MKSAISLGQIKKKNCLLALLFSLALAGAAQAQLKGKVVNLSGAGIPAVTVTASLTCTPPQPPGFPARAPFTLSNTTQSETDGRFEVAFPEPIPGGSSCGMRSYFWTTAKSGFTFSFVDADNVPPRQPVEIRGTDLPTWVNVSAASFSREASMASESITSVFGLGLAATTEVASTLPLPTALAGRSVRIIDSAGVERLASLLFASPTQFNYVLPAGLPEGVTTVALMGDGVILRVGFVQIVRISPWVFAANADGEGVPAALVVRVQPGNVQTFEPVARFDPTQRRFEPAPLDLGQENEFLVLALFGTGWRQAAVKDMQVLISKDDFTIELPLEYVGPQPTLDGLAQINARLPRALIGKGECSLVVRSGGRASNPVLLNFK
ncbi:MAG TPA: hypothetical protein VJ810_06860 [Blastocatellia bacterium]|nr:hypothetical protein [Blastocatellia bacterium]